MTEKQKKYEAELLEVIKKHKIAFFDHAFAFTSFCPATAYNHKLEKLESIKNAINENRVKAKNYMLNKWIGSNNPTLQVAAMRLLSSPQEHRLLNQSYMDHTTKEEKINTNIDLSKIPTDVLQAIRDSQKEE
jgi:hypothetical protein